MILKSKSVEPLQKKIKKLFEEAVKQMSSDDLVNGCAKEDFDNGEVEFDDFDKNMLSIYVFLPTLGFDRRTIDYAIVSDEDAKEV